MERLACPQLDVRRRPRRISVARVRQFAELWLMPPPRAIRKKDVPSSSALPIQFLSAHHLAKYWYVCPMANRQTTFASASQTLSRYGRCPPIPCAATSARLTFFTWRAVQTRTRCNEGLFKEQRKVSSEIFRNSRLVFGGSFGVAQRSRST